MSRRFISRHGRGGRRSIDHNLCEPLERRSLLAVTFTAGPLATPGNRPDGFVPSIAPAPFPETVVAMNPLDSANLATAPGPLYVSADAGAQLVGNTLIPLPPGYTAYQGDPVAAFDAQGRLFKTMLLAFPGRRDIAIAQMNPVTGQPIGTTHVIPNPLGAPEDKQWLAADANPDSPFANNLYMVWARRHVTPNENEIMFAHSRDQGQTWSTPRKLSDFNGPDDVNGTADDEGLVLMAEVAVAPDGDVFVSYHAQPEMNYATLTAQRHNPDGTSGKTFVVRLSSGDGGVTFVPQTKVEALPAGTSDVTINTQDAINGGTIPGARYTTAGSWQARVLPDPSRPGHVYLIAADDPDNVHGSGDDGDIVLARSTDDGATWMRSTVVSGPANGFQLFPTASIDRFGNIAIAWYDNRRGLTNAGGSFLLDFMATYSTDGGLTWAPEFRVNDLAFDPDPGAINWVNGPPPTTRIGEYFGIGLFGGTAHVAWNGNLFSGSTPTGQTMYHSSFAMAGSLNVTGDAGDDVISLNPLPGNPNFIEVVVNGQRQYAGLFDGLSGITIDAGGGTDTINIAQTGAALPITILPSGGGDVVNVNAAGAGAAYVVFPNTQRLSALSIGAGGLARVIAATNPLLTVGSLDLSGTGTLDLTDNALVIDYTGASPLAQVRAALTGGHNGGAWNGAGIHSSAAASAAGRALGYAEATDLFTAFPATFAGQQVDDTSVLVRYTRDGDADLNRSVNLNDFNRVAAHFGSTNAHWSQGDFNYDGLVNLDDFNRLAANFGLAAATAPAETRPRGNASRAADSVDELDLLD